MPNFREIPGVSEGDQSWLGSTHGTYNARTAKLRIADFTATDGYIKSGTPVAEVDGFLVPFDAAAADATTGDALPAATLAGFILTDQPVIAGSPDTILNVPLLDHGRVRVDRLPVEGFTAPASSNATIVFA
jgi:hypothetical protein